MRLNAGAMIDRVVEDGHGERAAYESLSEEAVSFDLLRRRCNQMGHLLRDLGVRREQRVLIALDNTVAFPVAFLGALRIGAVPVPVSPAEKPSNLRHFVEDSYAKLIVCETAVLAELQAALSGCGVRYLASGPGGEQGGDAIALDEALAAQDDELTPLDTHGDDVAFWLYSSGSTGRPKAVVHLHRAIRDASEAYGRHLLGLGWQDRVFASSRLHRAFGLCNALMLPLYFAATSLLLADDPTPEHLVRVLRELAPTVVLMVPGLYALLAGHVDADGAFAPVRLCVSGGEALPPRVFEDCRRRFGIELVDAIGSTEMLAIYCASRPGAAEPGTMGFPVHGFELRLTDESGAVIAGPGTGEMQVRGSSRAACYWHREDLSRSVMRGEWFATGDLCERRTDGSYVHRGRTDDMMKISGLWVSPAAIEQVLAEHPSVERAGVVGSEVRGLSRIVAFVKCADGVQPDDALADALRQRCRDRLDDHEYPHTIRFVDEVPLTDKGQPRRFLLREMLEGSRGAAHEHAEPARQDLSAPEPDVAAKLDVAHERGTGPRPVIAPEPRVLPATETVLEPRTEAERRAATGRLLALPAGERRAVLERLVAERLNEVMGEEPDRPVDMQRTFVQAGLDSLAAVELTNMLAQETGLGLSSTLTFDRPAPAQVLQLLMDRLQEVERAAAGGADWVDSAANADHGPRADSELLATLERAMERSAPPAMPGAPVGVRLQSSPLLRGLVPKRVAVRRAERRAARLWEDPEERESAIAAMKATISGTRREPQLREIARDHLIERGAQRALFWHRWSAQVDRDSAERVRAALASARGVLLSACHLGPYFCTEYAPPFLGHPTYLAAGAWFFQQPSADEWGRRLAHWRRSVRSRMLPVEGSFPVLQKLLARGDAVFVYFDMPGPRRTRFLGKPAMLADGSAQLALRADALVLPLRARRVGAEVWVDAAEPLDPREHAGAEELHEALAALHEAWILENPAAKEDPRQTGWQAGATPEAWVRPRTAQGAEPAERDQPEPS